LSPSGIRKFFEIVAENPDVISLSVGEPDFDAPWSVRESAIAALESGTTHYSANRGSSELRAAISKYFAKNFGVKYSPEKEILVGNGASEIFDLTIRAILNLGDEVILVAPSYVMYSPLVALAGGTPIFVHRISEIQKKISPRTRALVFGYPSNPTGATFDKIELAKIAKIVAKNNLLAISDEIYAELSFEKKHIAFASLPGMKSHTATISGFSKAFAMTGFRLGYLCAPEKLTAAANKIHQYSALCANSISQIAAIEALENCSDSVEKMRDEYRIRRDFSVRELRKMGFKIEKPAGAFYLFPNIRRKTGLSGDDFALRLLRKKRVAVVPGSAFGADFADHIRISFATSLDELEIAFERMANFTKNLK